jgi:hypothetical protein
LRTRSAIQRSVDGTRRQWNGGCFIQMDMETNKERLAVKDVSRVQLRAIFAGLAAAVGVLSICLGISFAIGLSTFRPTADRATGLALSLLIWGGVAQCIAILAGGYVAALVARCDDRRDGILHGVVVWGTAAALLDKVFLTVFFDVMNSLLAATGANDVAARAGVNEARSVGLAAQIVLSRMAREAGIVLWVFWAAVVGSLVTAIVGGWLGTRGERREERARLEAARAPAVPTGPTVPQPA